ARGILGQCYLESGKAQQAVQPMTDALAMCEKSGDAEGVQVYLRNLFEIQRYLGQRTEAVATANRLAAVLTGAEAARMKKWATVVAAGEPLCRVAVNPGGEIKELDEVVAPISGRLGFVWLRNRITLRPAQVLIETGDQLG